MTVARKPRDEELDAFGLTHRGNLRPENQDHFLLASLHKTMRVRGTSLPHPEVLEAPGERLASLLMVADGVGGSVAGEVASRAALETVADYVTHTMRCYYTSDPSEEGAFLTALQHAALATHNAILARARDPALEGMATTLTVGIGIWPVLYLVQVGDSRSYLLRRGVLEQLTRDQTMAQDLIDQGILPADKASRSPLSNVLSSSIGRKAEPEVSRVGLEPGDVLLFCTDGLPKHVSNEQIVTRLSEMTSAEQACRALVEDALAGGGTDNVTVLVARAVRREDPPTPA